MQKPSTRAGFHPRLPSTPFLARQANACLRLDGQLDQGRLNPRLRRVTFHLTRLGNLLSSFQIEGIDITAAQAAAALRGAPADRAPELDIATFGRIYQEIDEARDLADLTPETLRTWHAQMHPGVLDHGKPGEWKTGTNGVWDPRRNDWVFLATPPEDTAAELEALFAWLDREAHRLPPSMAAAIFFAEFQGIHPFADGNGRIGRLANLHVLKSLGMTNALLAPIDRQFKSRQAVYYEALATTNAGQDYTTWLLFYVDCLHRAYTEALQLADINAVFKGITRPSTRALLEWILADASEGWFSRGDYPNPEGLSGPTLWSSLNELSDLGILRARGEKKGREYALDWDALEERLDNAHREDTK